MAEPRRIAFETVRSLSKEKKPKGTTPTLRFNLKLQSGNEKTCPEYWYSDLAKSTRKKKEISDDPFGDEDEDDDKVRELARKFEEKYGPTSRKKNRWEDYIDRGLGYDEADPFIDNEEAYDELVPSSMTTEHGGFYINSGDLEFRQLSESDDGIISNEMKIRKKRKKLKEQLEKEAKRRKKLEVPEKDEVVVPKKRGRKPFDKSSQSALEKHKKKQPTVATLLQQHKHTMEQKQASTSEGGQSNSSSSRPDGDLENGASVKVPASSANIAATIDSVIKSVSEKVADNLNSPDVSESSENGDNLRLAINSIDAPKLPENLPEGLNEVLRKIKEAAFRSHEGKCKFFDKEVNRMLLTIELKSRELGCGHRSQIYNHLQSFLPCTKETLLKRAKKLRLDQEDSRLRGSMRKLKTAIAEAIPEMIIKYEEAGIPIPNVSGDDAKSSASESEGENAGDLNPGPKPRKFVFEWNDHLRQLLCEVVHVKAKCYEVSKLRTLSGEDYIKKYLKTEVKCCFPAGWISTKALFRESLPVHSSITSRPKKLPLLMKKMGPSIIRPNEEEEDGAIVKVLLPEVLSLPSSIESSPSGAPASQAVPLPLFEPKPIVGSIPVSKDPLKLLEEVRPIATAAPIAATTPIERTPSSFVPRVSPSVKIPVPEIKSPTHYQAHWNASSSSHTSPVVSYSSTTTAAIHGVSSAEMTPGQNYTRVMPANVSLSTKLTHSSPAVSQQITSTPQSPYTLAQRVSPTPAHQSSHSLTSARQQHHSRGYGQAYSNTAALASQIPSYHTSTAAVQYPVDSSYQLSTSAHLTNAPYSNLTLAGLSQQTSHQQTP